MRLRDKVLLTILLAVGCWVAHQYFVSRDEPVSNKPSNLSEGTVTSERLLDWYADGNKDYFDNALPKGNKITIIWVSLRYKGAMGDTECNPQGCLIRLDPRVNVAPVTTHLTLYHEMCHVATQGVSLDHGIEFQNCITMLFVKGALDGLI